MYIKHTIFKLVSTVVYSEMLYKQNFSVVQTMHLRS